MVFLFRLLSHLPLAWLHRLGALAGWLAYLGSPRYRRNLQANLGQAGIDPALRGPAAAEAGKQALELARIWMKSLEETNAQVAEVCGWEFVQAAQARGKGILFLTPHLGCFEMSVQAAARCWAAEHGDITILYRPARQRWLAQVLRTVRNRPGIQAVPTDMGGVRQMIKALRQGRAVGLLPDQVPPEGQGLWVPFFGRPAYTMTLAARLVQQTGAAVILARCERLPWGRGYVVYVEDLPMPLSDALEPAVLQLNQAMEGLIRQCPQQYLWGYARYKQPRQEPTRASAGSAA